MVEVHWIKIAVGIFDDEKILLIESMPEADAILVIWLKLLTFAGKQNNGGVLLMNDTLPYSDEMLATIFRRPLNTVRLALNTFVKLGMIEIVNDTITIPKWEKHQSEDKLAKIREQNANRQRKHRDKQKLLLENNVTGNVTVTLCHGTEEDTDTEGELESDLNLNIYCRECVEIVNYLNEMCGTSYRTNTHKTKNLIRARINEGFTVDDFKTVICKKAKQWKDDPKMCKYLRPETLFSNKFEGYLNEKTALTFEERLGMA